MKAAGWACIHGIGWLGGITAWKQSRKCRGQEAEYVGGWDCEIQLNFPWVGLVWEWISFHYSLVSTDFNVILMGAYISYHMIKKWGDGYFFKKLYSVCALFVYITPNYNLKASQIWNSWMPISYHEWKILHLTLCDRLCACILIGKHTHTPLWISAFKFFVSSVNFCV